MIYYQHYIPVPMFISVRIYIYMLIFSNYGHSKLRETKMDNIWMLNWAQLLQNISYNYDVLIQKCAIHNFCQYFFDVLLHLYRYYNITTVA